MIGGTDVSLRVQPARDNFDKLIRAARAVWPNGIIESDDGNHTYQEALRKRWSAPCEMFIYKTAKAQKSWTKFGLTKSNANQIVTVDIKSDEISFVVNEKDSESHAVIQCFKQLLQWS